MNGRDHRSAAEILREIRESPTGRIDRAVYPDPEEIAAVLLSQRVPADFGDDGGIPWSDAYRWWPGDDVP